MNYIDDEVLREEILKIKSSTRLKEIKQLLETKPSKELLKEQQDLLSKGYIENYPKTAFGEMVLQLVKRRATSYNFSGYTYKEEFYSNAIDKIMSYAIRNFDPEYVNPRTGKKSKAFSYLTEIASKAFVAIINEYREEQEEINNLIPYDSLYQNTINRSENKSCIVEDNINFNNEYYLIYDNKLKCEDTEYENIYCFLKEKECNNIKVVYPKEYKISLEEYDMIKTLKFDYLDLKKERDSKYVPSFPKRVKKSKENLTRDWE